MTREIVFTMRCLKLFKKRESMPQTEQLFHSRKADLDKNDSISHQHYEELIQNRLIQLYQEDKFYYSWDEFYLSDSDYPRMCTLLLYENHFRPIL